ncbi:MAG: tRNA lysidine(34) synthetase TilS [Bdellovibrionales bacterium]|nr:tRNA lysidine(34) synthetase TilS [Bdellovibrionales bacterium]
MSGDRKHPNKKWDRSRCYCYFIYFFWTIKVRKKGKIRDPKKEVTNKRRLRKKPLAALDHRVLDELRFLKKRKSFVLVAVSGGLDSMVLWEVMSRLKVLLGFELGVAHVHHGIAESSQGRFRWRAYEFVRKHALEKGERFFSNLKLEDIEKGNEHRDANGKGPGLLDSEADMRSFRYECLREWQQESSIETGLPVYLALAHHADDLLETRLIRLIRGTGLQGLEAMKICQNGLFRPLLCCSRRELSDYARQQCLEWMDDPSNQNQDFLRNWVRESWLPSLEKRHQGGTRNLGRSLDRIFREAYGGARSLSALSPATRDDFVEEKNGEKFLFRNRKEFGLLTLEEKRCEMASYLRRRGIKGYGQSHIDEIIKRLGTKRKTFSFKVLKWDWMVDAEQFVAIRSEDE